MTVPSAVALSANLTTFIGRTFELVEIGRLLRTSRVLTLVGPAGAGKTRLAAEVAGQVQRSGRGETVLVELASMTGASVFRGVTAALGVTGRPEAMAPGLSGREVLLVLDNCEHVAEECGALLRELLPRLPGLRVLATSRELLRLPGEVAFPVAGLLGSERVGGEPVGTGSDAVRLFIDRARSVAPGMEFTESDMADVAAICASLDGLPLEIELAVRLVRIFPLGDLRGRLNERLSLFKSGWRTADHRHQDLRTAIGWSYHLLSPPEQALFRRLSALPGGFGPDAALAVAQVGGIADDDVLALVAELEAKSLIVSCPDRGDSARFRMLESVRLYARERLVGHSEEGLTFDRVVDWLVELASPLMEYVTTTGESLERLKNQHDNLAYAADRLASTNDERQLLIAAALAQVRIDRGDLGDTAEVLARALERGDPDSGCRGVALGQAALVASRLGNHDEAVRLSEQAVALERRRGREHLVVRLLRTRSHVRMARGHGDAVTASLRETLEIARGLGDEPGVVACLNDLAWHLLQQGHDEQAEKLADEASRMVRRVRVPPGHQAALLHTTGALAVARNDLTAADVHFRQSLRAAEGDITHTVHALEGLANVALRGNRLERGLRLAAAVEAIHRDTGIWRDPWCERCTGDAVAGALKASPSGTSAEITQTFADLGEIVAYALEEQRPASLRPVGNDKLSSREWEVVNLVAQGLTNRQIGARLYLSARTVETHLRNVREALGLRSRAHVAAWAARLAPQASAV